MFFRRVFSRKENPAPQSSARSSRQGTATSATRSPRKLQRRLSTDDKRAGSVLQLTPLWEHIIRTRTLPDDLDQAEMFEEFLERLRDPEWQVRQHALRVLVDVLVVIGQKADNYFTPIVPQLVENLGHQAPTVRKGALDALRVYISETAMPETVLLQILDIGLNQRITNEPFGGRLTCGVMLSLPSLIQATLHTPKRNYILRSTIDMLVNKMGQVTHQEVTLKVLLRIRDLIGMREFAEYMSQSAYREFELLCSIYGLTEQKPVAANRSSWQFMNSFETEETSSVNMLDSFWRTTDEIELLESSLMQNMNEGEKVIMETEIKINDDTLTMRILESKDGLGENVGDKPIPMNHESVAFENGNIVTGPLENSGIIQVLTDSELEEINGADVDYGRRTPKRVTFGGEIVKMRTPDSDNVAQSDGDESASVRIASDSNLNFLTIDIPNDNTKPVKSVTPPSRPKSAQPPKSPAKVSSVATLSSTNPETSYSPMSPRIRDSTNRLKSASPKHRFKRINISPVDDIVSPKSSHKPVEVLHNLQRSPAISPTRMTRHVINSHDDDDGGNSEQDNNKENAADGKKREAVVQSAEEESGSPAKTWEDLNLVDSSTLQYLKSGDWRLRSRAICAIEIALRSSDNLALVQPCLDSLLRTLLSAEKNADVSEDKRRVLMNLISRLPLDNLEDRTTQIITGLCRQGGAGSNRVSKALMQRLPPAVIVLKLLSEEFLHARSSRFRENALQMVMYALMTFPSTYFDTATCVSRATYAALDRKKRVRQAALDVLAVLGQITSPRTVIEVVEGIARQRDEGSELFSAVKARLARKQLPMVSTDGAIQYSLRIPSPQANAGLPKGRLGADIEWISAGVGSVSPTSLKRRNLHHFNTNGNALQHVANQTNLDGVRRIKAPHEIVAFGVGNGNGGGSGGNGGAKTGVEFVNGNQRAHGNSGDEDGSKNGMQLAMATGLSTQTAGKSANENPFSINKRYEYLTNNVNKKQNAFLVAHSTSEIFGARISSFSDSSQDSRSSDENGGQRYSRHNVTSRFPAVDRLEVTGVCLDRHNLYDQHLVQQRLISTYPKSNPNVNSKKVHERNYSRDAFNESSFDDEPPGRLSYSGPFPRNSKRFMNIDKFMQTNKLDQTHIFDGHNVSLNEESINRNTVSNRATPEAREIQRSNVDLRTPVQRPPSKMGHIQTEMVSSSCAESSEISSEERCSSGHSTPTRPMGDVVTPLSVQHPSEPLFSSTPRSIRSFAEEKPTISRPQSTLSNKSNQFRVSRPQSAYSRHSIKDAEERSVTKISGAFEELKDDYEDDDNESIHESPVKEGSIKETPTKDGLQIPSPGRFVSDMSQDLGRSPVRENTVVEDIRNISPLPNQVFSETPELQNSPEKVINIVSTAQIEQPLELENQVEPENDLQAKENMIEAIQDVILETTLKSAESSPIVAPKSLIEASPTIGKSLDSIFDSPLKHDLDAKSIASTETSSDYQASHAASLDDKDRIVSDFVDVKAPRTPLRKAKTTLFGRSRKVSPAKHHVKSSKPDLFPQNMGGFDKPKEAINQSIAQLESPNWEAIMTGLKSLVRLMRNHPEIIDLQIHMICMQLSKAVKNLRSQVARAACQAAKEFFTMHSKSLEQECDDLVGSLLHRTADTNRFLRADALRALESMCDHLTPQKVLGLLTTRGVNHQNAVVRGTSAKLLTRLADRIGPDRIYNMSRENRDKFITAGANLLMEGSLETRCYAKSLFRLLSDNPMYSRILLEVIPPRTYRNIEKTLKSIR